MGKGQILIVEDDRSLAEVLDYNLRQDGYQTLVANDGHEGLRQAKLRTPDLVVLDLTLRALDGLSVQQELAARAITAAIPIVIVTASTLPLDGVDVACILRKPVTPEELVRTVQQCLIAGAPAPGI